MSRQVQFGIRKRTPRRFHHQYFMFRIVRIRFVLPSIDDVPSARQLENFLKSAGQLVAWTARFSIRHINLLGDGFAVYDRPTSDPWDERSEACLFSSRFLNDDTRVLFKKNTVGVAWNWMTYNRLKCYWPILQLGAMDLHEDDERQTLPVLQGMVQFFSNAQVPTAEDRPNRQKRVRRNRVSRRPLTEDEIRKKLESSETEEYSGDDSSNFSSDSSDYDTEWPGNPPL